MTTREFECLDLTIEHGVARLTLNRPTEANALNQALLRQFERAVEVAVADPSCHVLVLRGSGRFFCAGGDVLAMAEASDPHEMLFELAQVMHRGVLALARSRLVVIAAVQGPAAGAGLGLVLNADLVVATPAASFIAAYGSVGLTPDCGVSFLLPRVVGLRRAARMLYEAHPVSPHEALEWGIVTELVDDDTSLDARVRELASAIATSATHAIGPTRQLVNAATMVDYEQHLAEEARLIAELVRHPTTSQTIADFAERSRARRAGQDPSRQG